MKRVVIAAAVIAGTLVTAASAIELTIHPGVGIGKVKLGMTATQAKKALGENYIVNERKSVNGAVYLELAWNYTEWTVGLLANRVVLVGTTLRSHRTPTKIGAGSTATQVVRAYPLGRCVVAPALRPPLAYIVSHKGGTQTMFRFTTYVPKVNQVPLAQKAVLKVFEINVRRPYEQLSNLGCPRDWYKPRTP